MKALRVLRVAGYCIAGSLVLALTGYGAFLANEYVAGGSYVKYLASNHESTELDQDFSFELMQDDLASHSLVMVGEIHGFNVPTRFDVELFTHLNQQHDFDIYLVEMDLSQAYYLNQYNQTGDGELLNRVLEKWVVTVGRDNTDYRSRWQRLQAMYASGNEFTYIGADRLIDVELLFDHLTDLSRDDALVFDALETEEQSLNRALAFIDSRLVGSPISAENQWLLNHLQRNIELKLAGTSREPVMTENLLSIYEHYGLFEQKVYGFFGLGHTLQHHIAEGHVPMAARLKQSDDWFAANMLSINTVLLDSYMTVESSSLPGFLSEEGPYTPLATSYDNIWMSYMRGITDLARVTNANSKTLFKLDGQDSPYRQSQRLFQMIKLLPFGSTMNAAPGAVTTDYGQYILFIRNSDWANPSVSAS